MQSNLFDQRVSDTADICEKNSALKFLGFLSPEEAKLADEILKHRIIRYGFFGGYEAAQRVFLGCFPDWAEAIEYPIASVTATFRKADRLSHRDVLGSLMALGIKRETVGDILEEGRAVIFLAEETADYVLTQLEKIGRVGVTLQKGFTPPLPMGQTFKDFSATVSSARLDCVICALANLSRTDAARIIEQGFVRLNSVEVQKVTRQVEQGDIISVRGSGKFIVESLSERTRKDRIILKYKKYI